MTSSLAAAALATFVGLLGDWSIVADGFSHFRVQLALMALPLGVAALFFDRRLTLAAAVIAAANIALASTYARTPVVAAAGGTTLKVMTINVLHGVDNDPQIVAQIAAQNPDVILLQELKQSRLSLLQHLMRDYPWQVSCAGAWACDVAIVSRRRWETAQAQPVGSAGAKMAWARFGQEWGGALVASVHLRWPIFSDQSAQLRGVGEVLASHRGPVVVAGDLNSAAWSAAVRSFTRQSQLASAGGFVATWPRRTSVGGHPCMLCVPQLQIDHILVNRQIRVLAVQPGGDVGSDHLPLIAELEFTRSVAVSER